MANSAPLASIYAGDSMTWTASLSAYPATSYDLRCIFTRPGVDPVEIDGVASGDDYDFTLDAGKSGSMREGGWSWLYRAIAQDGTSSKVVQSGSITVRPDPGADREPSHAEKCLALIKAALENRFFDVQESFSMLGQDISKVPAETLETMHNRYQKRVNEEHRKYHRLLTGSRRRRSRIYLTD